MLKNFHIALPNTIANKSRLLALLHDLLDKQQANCCWLLDDQQAFLLFVYNQTEYTFTLTVKDEVETWCKQYETIEALIQDSTCQQ